MARRSAVGEEIEVMSLRLIPPTRSCPLAEDQATLKTTLGLVPDPTPRRISRSGPCGRAPADVGGPAGDVGPLRIGGGPRHAVALVEAVAEGGLYRIEQRLRGDRIVPVFDADLGD